MLERLSYLFCINAVIYLLINVLVDTLMDCDPIYPLYPLKVDEGLTQLNSNVGKLNDKMKHERG